MSTTPESSAPMGDPLTTPSAPGNGTNQEGYQPFFWSLVSLPEYRFVAMSNSYVDELRTINSEATLPFVLGTHVSDHVEGKDCDRIVAELVAWKKALPQLESVVLRCEYRNLMKQEAKNAIHQLTRPDKEFITDEDFQEMTRLRPLIGELEDRLPMVIFLVQITHDLALACFYAKPNSM